MIFCSCFGPSKVQNVKQKNIPPRLLIIGSYFSGEFNGSVERRYEVLRTFIVNYSNDTFKFWNTKCRTTELFSITKNDFMHLTDECKNSEFEEMTIPPHRSLLIPLKLVIDKQPHEIVRLKVNMKFYRWFATDNFIEVRKNHPFEILNDTIILKYNKDGNSYYEKSDWKVQEQKTKSNLPTTKLYLLSAEDRKNYTVTADETKISRAPEEEFLYNKQKVFRIPITVHNNSNKPLKYYSMSCSWQEFYHINNENLKVGMSVCDKNIPIEVVVPSGSSHTDLMPFVYKKNKLKKREHFRIGLNINKMYSDKRLIDYIDLLGGYEDELRGYNIVWSNDVSFETD